MKEILSVQVVEDDYYIRARLVKAIEGHDRLNLMSQSGTFCEAKAALSNKPDILLVDLGLPDGDGTELIRLATHQSKGKIKCIVFSMFGDENRVIRAIEAGATGYLLKDTEISALPVSIIALAQGKSPISPAIASHLLKRFQPLSLHQQGDEDMPALSEREVEVLKLVAKGCSAKEIANLLDISYHTVVSHTKKIYQKLNVNSRTEAVFEAQQVGIIQRNHS